MIFCQIIRIEIFTTSIFSSTSYIVRQAKITLLSCSRNKREINLPQIRHIIPNDETAVESSPAHILKNRPKYQQITTRRPKIFATTTTTSTTTEAVPVATAMPDNGVYTVRPKTKPDETKTTRVRGRTRRPTKKTRTTTSTTESGLEANNELPLDENYPRITSQQLPVTAAGQQPLYDDNFDVAPQFALNRDRPAQPYEESGDNVSKFSVEIRIEMRIECARGISAQFNFHLTSDIQEGMLFFHDLQTCKI